MRQWKLLRTCGIGCLLWLLVRSTGFGCPLCQLTTTFSDQVAQRDVACLVRCVAVPADKENASARFEVLHVLKNWKETLHKRDRFSRVVSGSTKAGDLHFITGTWAGTGTAIDWALPSAITDAAFRYLVQAPPQDADTKTRLAYYFNYLENSDQIIANDSFGEFAKAPYGDVVALAGHVPRDAVRRWFTNPKTPQTRLGFYGLLLGLCGDADDARRLEEILSKKSDQFRLGLDGMIFGYLLLEGNAGLKRIEDWKFNDKSAPLNETYSAMKAVELFADFAPQKIKKARLSESLQLLLDRTEVADLAIATLARWEDWSVQDRLRKLYGTGAYESPILKKAVVRYMIASTKTASSATDAKVPLSVERGRRYLDEIRAKDPRLVKDVERFSQRN